MSVSTESKRKRSDDSVAATLGSAASPAWCFFNPNTTTREFLSRIIVVEQPRGSHPILVVRNHLGEDAMTYRYEKDISKLTADGTVSSYRTLDAGGPERVALKTFHSPEDVHREAAVIDTMDRMGFMCENLVVTAMPTNQTSPSLDHTHIVMEHMEGDLWEYRKHNDLSLHKAASLASQVANACLCLLKCNLYYVDVKLQNCLYRRGEGNLPRVCLGDLGGVMRVETGGGLLITYVDPWLDVPDSPRPADRAALYERLTAFGIAIAFLELLGDDVSPFWHGYDDTHDFKKAYPTARDYVNMLTGRLGNIRDASAVPVGMVATCASLFRSQKVEDSLFLLGLLAGSSSASLIYLDHEL